MNGHIVFLFVAIAIPLGICGALAVAKIVGHFSDQKYKSLVRNETAI